MVWLVKPSLLVGHQGGIGSIGGKGQYQSTRYWSFILGVDMQWVQWYFWEARHSPWDSYKTWDWLAVWTLYHKLSGSTDYHLGNSLRPENTWISTSARVASSPAPLLIGAPILFARKKDRIPKDVHRLIGLWTRKQDLIGTQYPGLMILLDWLVNNNYLKSIDLHTGYCHITIHLRYEYKTSFLVQV